MHIAAPQWLLVCLVKCYSFLETKRLSRRGHGHGDPMVAKALLEAQTTVEELCTLAAPRLKVFLIQPRLACRGLAMLTVGRSSHPSQLAISQRSTDRIIGQSDGGGP